jgi:hypothetical protein
VVAKFVTKPKHKKETPKTEQTNTKATRAALSIPPTPGLPSGVSTPTTAPTVDSVMSALKAQAPVSGPWMEPDGSIVNTVAVSQMCITVPPAIVLAVNGFAAHAGVPHSHANPPPHWSEHVQPLMSPLHGGSRDKFRHFLSGGWRELPEGDRWWEHALGVGVGENDMRAGVEARRLQGLQAVGKLPTGLAGLRGL